MAAIQLVIASVPVLRLSHLSEEARRAYILADNKLAEHAGWDQELLAIELQALLDVSFDLSVTGFETAEIDLVLEAADAARGESTEDAIPELANSGPAVTEPGDVWALGPHRLMCGDARDARAVNTLVARRPIDMIFTDPPYNVAIDGHVCGSGSIKHSEFAFASGEMSQAAFTTFLTDSLSQASRVSKSGAIAFVCMDWRHMREMLDAGAAAFTELKNLCVWNKTNAGMGSFYRSKHELVFVYKVGKAKHTNSFGLGDTGRYRTNVWDYAGLNVPGTAAQDALAMHPTVKPVNMIADALRDCCRRGERVLDLFGGSGSTLIAAETTGRVAHLMEYSPQYCDVILTRYANMTSQEPIHIKSGEGFTLRSIARGLQREEMSDA